MHNIAVVCCYERRQCQARVESPEQGETYVKTFDVKREQVFGQPIGLYHEAFTPSVATFETLTVFDSPAPPTSAPMTARPQQTHETKRLTTATEQPQRTVSAGLVVALTLLAIALIIGLFIGCKIFCCLHTRLNSFLQ